MHSLEVQADSNGELFFEFPDDLLKDLDWQVGDTLSWAKQDDYTWILKKEKDNVE